MEDSNKDSQRLDWHATKIKKCQVTEFQLENPPFFFRNFQLIFVKKFKTNKTSAPGIGAALPSLRALRFDCESNHYILVKNYQTSLSKF